MIVLAASVVGLQSVETEELQSILDKGLYSSSLDVVSAAVRMQAYNPDPDTWNRVAERIDFNKQVSTTNGRDMLFGNALATLYSLDKKRTLFELTEVSNMYLDGGYPRFNLVEVFDAIGYEHMPLFTNIFNEIEMSDINQDGKSFLTYMAHIQAYLSGGGDKHLYQVEYRVPKGLSVTQYRYLYEYLAARGLPVKKIELLLYDEGGSGFLYRTGLWSTPAGVNRTYTIEEMLYQSLLCRLGITGSPYRVDFFVTDKSIPPRITENETVVFGQKLYSLDYGSIEFSGYLQFCDALAEIYCGMGDVKTLSTITAQLDEIDPKSRAVAIRTIADAPDAGLTRSFFAWCLDSFNLDLQRVALDFYLAQPDLADMEIINLYIQDCKDVYALTLALKVLALDDNGEHNELFSAYLENESELVRVTAAGLLLSKR
jgi:hypothetical protein